MLGSETEKGQSYEAKQSGVHRSRGQINGQYYFHGRRGVVWNQNGGVGPTGLATNYHQRWWVRWVAAETEQGLALLLSLSLSTSLRKIY